MSDHPLVVCVLGMHRSGSSLAAQILAGHGMRTGRRQVGRSRFNREGHTEDRFVVRTDKKILLHFGGSWDRPPELPDRWLEDPRIRHLVGQASRYRRRQAAHPAPYFFKDPRASLVIPFWQEVFGTDLRFLVVLRDPEVVVRSVLARQREWLAPERRWWRLARNHYHRLQGALEPLRPLDETEVRALYWTYYESILRGLPRRGVSVLVHERLLADPATEARRLVDELGLPAARIDTSMVKPTLTHSRGNRPGRVVAALARRLRAQLDGPPRAAELQAAAIDRARRKA